MIKVPNANEQSAGTHNHTSKRRRKHDRQIHHEEVHEGEGPWIVSYADMMTLLFCFFVIMTSFASFDPITVAKKSAKVAEHFAPGEASQEEKTIQGLGLELGGLKDLQGLAKAEVKDSVLQIVFSSSVMFESGDIEIKEDAAKKIDVMIGLIRNKNPDYRIIIEGHTDNSPLMQTSPFRSNWDLSSARAAALLERFEHYGFPGKQLVSVGYGESRPLVPNEDKHGQRIPENQAFNRRVVVKVLQPLKSSKNKKIGIPPYFDENEILKE